MRNLKSVLVTASALIALTAATSALAALPPGYDRTLARQQVAAMAQAAYVRKVATLAQVQRLSGYLRSDRMVDDNVTELQSTGLQLGLQSAGSDGNALLDKAMGGRTKLTAGITTSAPGQSATNALANAQAATTAQRSTVSTAITQMTAPSGVKATDKSQIAEAGEGGFGAWVAHFFTGSDPDKEWQEKYGPKQQCDDGGDPMCGHKFHTGGADNGGNAGGGASIPDPDGTRTKPTQGQLTSFNPNAKRDQQTNPGPEGTTAPSTSGAFTPPSAPGGGVSNPGSAVTTTKVKVTTPTKPPVAPNDPVTNPDRSNGAPATSGQPSSGNGVSQPKTSGQ